MEEVWKDVVGYEGYYQISNKGNVKSMKRTLDRINGRPLNLCEKILKQSTHRLGYKKLKLTDINKASSLWYVHRLVAIAFIPNVYEKPHVNHINSDRADNRVENLEWVTVIENSDHAKNKGRLVSFSGEQNGNSHISDEVVKEIRLLKSTGEYFQNEIASMYGISTSQVSNIVRCKQRNN